MTPTNITDAERSEIETLLPWYVAGTLEPEDARRIEARLAGDPALSQQLALLREEQYAVVEINEDLGAPSPGALARLMASVDAEASGFSGVARAGQGLWARLTGFFQSPSGSAVRWAAAAAAVVIMVQAVALGTLLRERTAAPGIYQTASGSDQQPARVGTFVLARFDDAASAGEISAHLADIDAVIVDGPKPGGIYRIRLSREVLNEQDRTRAVKKLRGDCRIVTFVRLSR